MDAFELKMRREQPRWPDARWSCLWIKRIYEFQQANEASVLKLEASELINFLKHVRAGGTPTWQRHQAAIAASRYLEMTQGSVSDEIREIVLV